jgi:hypothetical protein
MKPTGENNSFVLPPALLAEVEAAADEEHRPVADVVRELVETRLSERRRSEILSRVDVAEASLARGEGIAITQESVRQLAEDVKQGGRARLAAENVARR